MPEIRVEGTSNPCIRCGACCAMYKITFSVTEIDPGSSGGVPDDMALVDGPMKRTMKGTEKRPKRCIALQGVVGELVCCRIYDRRPSPCRDFKAAWQENGMNEQCNRARAVYGLPVFDII